VFSAWVYLPNNPPTSTTGTSCTLRAFDGASPAAEIPLTGSGVTKAPLVLGSWFSLSGTFPTTAAGQEVARVNVECDLPADWDYGEPEHVWYLDDVQMMTP
jgi:hypothetical protein